MKEGLFRIVLLCPALAPAENDRRSEKLGTLAEITLDDKILESYIDKLVLPVIEIIRYYPNREIQRRSLLLTWAANLFKPMAAVEISRILGYDYKRVWQLFTELSRSSVLVEVDDGAAYCRVGTEGLPLYVRRDAIVGERLSGRPPILYVFKERPEIDMVDFIERFNRDSDKAWKYATQKVLGFIRDFDVSYQEELRNDALFLLDKIKPVLRLLEAYGTIFIDRKAAPTRLEVPLKGTSAYYNIPSTEPFGRVV